MTACPGPVHSLWPARARAAQGPARPPGRHPQRGTERPAFYVKSPLISSDTNGEMAETKAPPNPYLRDAVMTASPEQLQLMLYEGAIRFASQGREAVQSRRYEDAFHSLTRAQRIVLEMHQGLNHDVAPELCDRMASLYAYVYRKLVDGCVRKDTAAIDEALRILRYERDTWLMLMDKLAKERTGTRVSEGDESAGLAIDG